VSGTALPDGYLVINRVIARTLSRVFARFVSDWDPIQFVPKPEITLEAKKCLPFLRDLHLDIKLILYLTRDKSCKIIFQIGAVQCENFQNTQSSRTQIETVKNRQRIPLCYHMDIFLHEATSINTQKIIYRKSLQLPNMRHRLSYNITKM
jgi:hypothetical protein